MRGGASLHWLKIYGEYHQVLSAEEQRVPLVANDRGVLRGGIDRIDDRSNQA